MTIIVILFIISFILIITPPTITENIFHKFEVIFNNVNKKLRGILWKD
jgi:hypothetical protein